MADPRDDEKRLAATAAAALVESGMAVGLGTGSTVAHLLPALAARALEIVCVATSPATAASASALGLHVEPFETLTRLDVAIDGADQVSPDFWLVKGGGGAHTREKIVADAADRFVVIVSSDKLVEEITAPVPLELFPFGIEATIAALGAVARREGAGPSPDGGVIADYLGPVTDLAELALRFDATPGVAGHGLFRPQEVHDVLVARGAAVEHRRR